MKRVFIIEKSNIVEDSWTHGDWKQYRCWVDDDTVIIARASMAPFIWAVIGFSILLVALLVVFNVPYQFIDWWGMAAMITIGFLLMTATIIEWLSPWRWMVQLYPPIKKNSHGRFIRDYLDV